MNTTLLKAGAEHGGPVVLIAGAAMLAAALALPGHPPGPSASGPTPVATVTVTRAPVVPPVAARTPEPSAGAVRTIVAADSQHGPAGRSVPEAAASGPSPAPESPAPGGPASPAPGAGSTSGAGGCEGAVSVRLPLGALPGCAITIGGAR